MILRNTVILRIVCTSQGDFGSGISKNLWLGHNFEKIEKLQRKSKMHQLISRQRCDRFVVRALHRCPKGRRQGRTGRLCPHTKSSMNLVCFNGNRVTFVGCLAIFFNRIPPDLAEASDSPTTTDSPTDSH